MAEVRDDVEWREWTRAVVEKPKLRATAQADGSYCLVPATSALCKVTMIDEMWAHDVGGHELLEVANGVGLNKYFHMCTKPNAHIGYHGCSCKYTWARTARMAIVNGKTTAQSEGSSWCQERMQGNSLSCQNGHYCKYTNGHVLNHKCAQCSEEWVSAPKTSLMASACNAYQVSSTCKADGHRCRLEMTHKGYHHCYMCEAYWEPLSVGGKARVMGFRQAALPSVNPAAVSDGLSVLGIPIEPGRRVDAGLFAGRPDPGDLSEDPLGRQIY